MTDKGPFDHWQRAVEARTIPTPTPSGREGLSPVFQFSQNSLQDYVDCQRRFQLRYVLDQRWPAAESEPIEEHEHFVEQGSQFHLLIQRHLLGLDAEKLTPADDLLREWWENYLASDPLKGLPNTFRQPEVQLSTPMLDQRLLARFDVLAIDPGERAVIVDWKTTRYRPDRRTLAARLQSRIYPFVLAEAGAFLFGGSLAPEQISLIYWFANEPGRPEVFAYDQAQHEHTRTYLEGLIAEILGFDQETWPLTDDHDLCSYCVYRSLCDRGTEAGTIRETAADPGEFEPGGAVDFSLDDLDEISF